MCVSVVVHWSIVLLHISPWSVISTLVRGMFVVNVSEFCHPLSMCRHLWCFVPRERQLNQRRSLTRAYRGLQPLQIWSYPQRRENKPFSGDLYLCRPWPAICLCPQPGPIVSLTDSTFVSVFSTTKPQCSVLVVAALGFPFSIVIGCDWRTDRQTS